MNYILFLLLTLAAGFISGGVIGILVKKISRTVIVLVAVIFILIQLSIINNILPLGIEFLDKFREYLSSNLDFTTIKGLLMANLPLTAGLVIGFIYGLKKG